MCEMHLGTGASTSLIDYKTHSLIPCPYIEPSCGKRKFKFWYDPVPLCVRGDKTDNPPPCLFNRASARRAISREFDPWQRHTKG